MPKRGDLALCSKGHLGMITSDYKHNVSYGDGTFGIAYIGVYLEKGCEGQPWSSRNPTIIGHISSVLDTIRDTFHLEMDDNE